MAFSVSLVGSRGRMGQTILAAAKERGIQVVSQVDVGDDMDLAFATGDVVIDFSFHSVTESVIARAAAARKPLVIGTTGHFPEEKKRLSAIAAAAVPCVWAGNYSVGVNLLFALVRRASRVLGPDYDAEVIEMHHRFKKDAPSGTAARLLEIILEERKLGVEALRHGRQGIPGERSTAEVGMHALRGGDVVGDHTVMFAALGERIELTHKASDRGIFARGALRAAEWVVSQPKGIYDMQDVLKLQ